MSGLGIGIDTGGTCTDAVIYRFEDKEILASAKTHTTHDDLARGIRRALERLPKDLAQQAEVVALSTTLATNACVENKGGRAKVAMFGAHRENVEHYGSDYGFERGDGILFVDSKTRPSGKIVEMPDWDDFTAEVKDYFKDCDAAGVVEMYANKTGGVLENRAREIIKEAFDIPVVCGNELFAEKNIIKRGANTLLNARLISIIEEFTEAVRKSLKELGIKAPFVIVRSDGSLMSEKFAKTHPIETLLCGPVASVKGAVELAGDMDSMVIDIGGTTTDIALVKNRQPKNADGGVRIGRWNTFVKGLFVDTFGLGGDSGVTFDDDYRIILEDQRVIPLCMTAHRYPAVLDTLEKIAKKTAPTRNPKDDIFLGEKDIAESAGYSDIEKRIATALLDHPMSLEELSIACGQSILHTHLERLVRESVIIRCGITPTDVMHVRGDFDRYSVEASRLGLTAYARYLHKTIEEVGEDIYEAVRKKLYINLVRVLLEDADPKLHEEGCGPQVLRLIEMMYEQAVNELPFFVQMPVSTPAVLIGVGAPTHVFLPEVGRLLGAEVVSSPYAGVANAIGAVVGGVRATVAVEVRLNPESGTYTVFGGGTRSIVHELDDAKDLARQRAVTLAEEEARRRGAGDDLHTETQEEENVVETDFGRAFLGFVVTATVNGQLDLSRRDV